MKQQNESVERLEIGRDYVNVHNNSVIVIDRTGDIGNRGFYDDLYKNYLSCWNHSEWREATELEVIEAFEKHLVYRYGEDWETMKIKEKHPRLINARPINDGSRAVEFSKNYNGWTVWNKNGLLYCHGVWVERLEEEEINIKASETQIGGNHYSEMAIQPTEFIHKNGLSFIQGNVIKYVCRYKAKNGIEDLNKAKHYIDLLIEFEEE